MLKKVLSYAALLACVAIAFTACKKDEQEAKVNITNQVTKYDLDETFPVLKNLYTYTFRTLYMYDITGTPVAVKCTTITDPATKKGQEWMTVDCLSDLVSTQLIRNDDNATGAIYGVYYPWAGIKDLNFDGLLTDLNGNGVVGFHVPTMDEVHNLATMRGSYSAIRPFLLEKYDGYSIDYWTQSMTGSQKIWDPNTSACMWYDSKDNPNANQTYGAFYSWDLPNSDYFSSNCPNYAVRVNLRLMRLF